MTFNPVPWAVGGGAANTPESARQVAYLATQGNDGVAGFADLRVTQTPTASAAVAIATGAYVIPLRADNYQYQSYTGARPVADDFLPIPANGGAGVRCDLVVARVEDPNLATESWPAPSDPKFGPYVYPRVYTDVGAAVIASRGAARAFLRGLKHAAIPLAGLTLQASAQTVLTSSIVDLRSIAQPHAYRAPALVYSPGSNVNVPGSWADWLAPTLWTVDVPDWATHATLISTVHGARVDKQSGSTAGKTAGQLRVKFGTDGAAVLTQATLYDFDAPANSGTTRQTVAAADTVTLPPAYRGTAQRIYLQGDQTAGNQPLIADANTSAILDVEFTERPA